MIEIERKFLVVSDAFKGESTHTATIVQGFLNSDPQRTVRIRLTDTLGIITVKGPSNLTGTSRFEWEKEIDIEEARALLSLCEPGVIRKTRYRVPAKRHVFDVDVFHGENEGLILAEIELSSEEESFVIPAWIGKEVTGDNRYYNSQLSKKPYKTWKDEL